MESEKGKASSLCLEGRGQAADAEDKAAEKAFEDACIMRCLDGDREAFRPLVDRHGPALFAFTLRLVGNRDDAMELTQEVFARAFRNLADFNTRYRFSTWIYAIALNLCRDHRRRQMKSPSARRVDLDLSLVGCEDPVERTIDARRRLERLARCLDRLPPTYREALVMKDVMGLAYRDMQKVTSIPVTLLKIRVVRARKKLVELVTAMETGGGEP